MSTATMDSRAPAKPERFYRHRLVTRMTHWTNALALGILLFSGLAILNSHPSLYWGQYGADADKPFIHWGAVHTAHGWRGVTTIAGYSFDTTGVFGLSSVDGQIRDRAYPWWLTLPSRHDLGASRQWHFFFAWVLVLNGLIYWLFGFISRHIQRDIALKKGELEPKHLLEDVIHHAQLKAPRGEASKSYNTLQKLAYLAVIFGLIPLMVLTGLTMSPGFNAIVPYLLDLFGGRQSARTIHFLTANFLVLFFLVHIFEVFVAGAWNEIRSMVTGWYVVKPEKVK